MNRLMRLWYLLPIVLAVLCSMNTSAQSASEINWKTLQEVEALVKKSPKKVLVSLYTDWCGWCKRMDATTYKDPQVIQYINKHFYAVRFNPEKVSSITFKGKTYGMNGRANALSSVLMRGSQGYPTTSFLDEKLEVISPVPGYQDVAKMMAILTYIGEDHYKTTDWNSFYTDYSKRPQSAPKQ